MNEGYWPKPTEKCLRILVEEEDRVSVVCDDYELFDWMDDLFAEEHDLDDVVFYSSSSGAKSEYRITFPPSVDLGLVREIISGLDELKSSGCIC
ncbi:MAG: hypothetical protein GKR90_16240 [Pseudomonadales bacterium]|nr:hypothetical protein [Pseudomonadales bacterium]